MSSVVVDSETLARLRQTQGRVEIRDKAVQLVGHFTPLNVQSSGVAPCRGVEAPFSNEDLDQFESEAGGRTLNEILTDLEKRS